MVFSGGVWGAQTLFNPTQSHAGEGATQSWSGGHSPSDSPPSLRTTSWSPHAAALAGSGCSPGRFCPPPSVPGFPSLSSFSLSLSCPHSWSLPFFTFSSGIFCSLCISVFSPCNCRRPLSVPPSPSRLVIFPAAFFFSLMFVCLCLSLFLSILFVCH